MKIDRKENWFCYNESICCVFSSVSLENNKIEFDVPDM